MTMLLNRRAVLTGGGAAAVVLVAGADRLLAAGPRNPDQNAEAFVNLLANVHNDYANGRVVEYQGWVLSQHEFDTIGKREGKQQKLVSVG